MPFKLNNVLLIVLIFSFYTANVPYAASGDDFPSPRGFVNDYSGVLPQNSQDYISGLCRDIKDKTGIEVAVVIMDSIAPVDIEEYSVRLFEKWGIGEKSKDNGVLFITVVKDRKTRIEVGYGLEGFLTDGYCGETLDAVLLYYKEGDYSGGIITGVERIAYRIGKEYNLQFNSLQQGKKTLSKRGSGRNSIYNLFVFILFLLVSFINRLRISSNGRRRRGYWIGGMGPGGWGGLSGGSGSFGGFGGFGGGLSGGGGAGRSW